MDESMWAWLDSAVEMIPFGLLAGFCGEKEIRITKIAEEGFCFRLCAASEIAELQEKLRLCFYNLKRDRYQELEVTPDAWKLETRTEFFSSYAVAVRQEDYCHAVRTLLGQYDRYIRLKLEEDDSELAEQMTGYPAEKDELFADSFQEQMEKWFGRGKNRGKRKAGKHEMHNEAEENEVADLETQRGDGAEANPVEVKREGMKQAETGKAIAIEPELALELDHPRVYTQFLEQEQDDFLAEYQKRYPVFRDCFQNRRPNRLYIGNAFCHLLFPEQEQLFALLEKAKKESMQVTLTFSYVREYQLKQTAKLLKELQQWCRNENRELEIEVNDWAMADMLKCDFPDLIPCYGRMLNKRKKDPRMAYKKGNVDLLQENSLNAEFYREYLNQEFGIHRFEWESCGYEQKFPEPVAGRNVENHLHLPFYQTNTSQYCTLYAGSAYGDRGRQSLLTNCDKRCERQVYLYPRHLNMVGRYNSLFGKDPEILDQAGIVPYNMEKTREFCRKNHIERLVLPYWL